MRSSTSSTPVYLGIDVQVSRGCAYYAIDASGAFVASGWLETDGAADAATTLVAALTGGVPSRAVVGIDAPRMPLPTPRGWAWSGARATWRRSDTPMRGRHCEVAIAALRYANPQWTPLAADAPPWMQWGFRLFAELGATGATVHEVFPSAAYTQLAISHGARVELDIGFFANGPKDMLDAAVSALVVREYAQGRGGAVGDGDGLGTIVLPRPVSHVDSPVLRWPVETVVGT